MQGANGAIAHSLSDTTQQQALKKKHFSSRNASWVVPCGLASLKVTEPMDHDFDANFDKAVL